MDELSHVTVDCTTGEVTTVALTPDELAQREADAQAAAAAEQARLDAIAAAEAQRVADAQNLMALFPNASADQVDSFKRILGIE